MKLLKRQQKFCVTFKKNNTFELSQNTVKAVTLLRIAGLIEYIIYILNYEHYENFNDPIILRIEFHNSSTRSNF